MSRRAAHAKILAAQTQLRALDTRLDVDMQTMRQRMRPSWLLAGGFTAGFATILLPRNWRAGLFYSFGSVAWPLARLFAPTLLKNFMQNSDMAD